jgi:hypothetical protein
MKIMKIKIYDKIMDLVGREGYKLVSSDFKKIVGSKFHMG